MNAPIHQIVIAGGGSAGWMAAAALSHALAGTDTAITLVESEEIGTIGVGEATIPPIGTFNQIIGVDEAAFLRATQGTFKLGIEFVDWWRRGHRYFHPFGRYGDDFGLVKFHQHWLAAQLDGDRTPLAAFSLATAAAEAGRFALPDNDPRSVFATFGYAYHFDAGRYAGFLRQIAEGRGVVRREGRILEVERRGGRGHVAALHLEDGSRVEGELFLDCTGFHGLLIGETLGIAYHNWSTWLPCDRAIAVPTATAGSPAPFTRSTARDAGWQWEIPLQHRIGNGHVYCSGFMEDDAAEDLLRAHLPAAPTAEARRLRFTTGRRAEAWSGNVVSLGLSAGFLEPLESTSLHLIQTGISNLLSWFPDSAFDPGLTTEYNRRVAREFDAVRDFLILHYAATDRDDTAFWRHCRMIPLPDSLRAKIDLFSRTGRLLEREGDIFQDASWLAVMLGQGIMPAACDPLTAGVPGAERSAILAAMRKVIASTVARMPRHADAVAAICRQRD